MSIRLPSLGTDITIGHASRSPISPKTSRKAENLPANALIEIRPSSWLNREISRNLSTSADQVTVIETVSGLTRPIVFSGITAFRTLARSSPSTMSVKRPRFDPHAPSSAHHAIRLSRDDGSGSISIPSFCTQLSKSAKERCVLI